MYSKPCRDYITYVRKYYGQMATEFILFEYFQNAGQKRDVLINLNMCAYCIVISVYFSSARKQKLVRIYGKLDRGKFKSIL